MREQILNICCAGKVQQKNCFTSSFLQTYYQREEGSIKHLMNER